MPYLGSQLARGFATTTKQSFSGDASTVAFTLTRNAGQATDLEVFVDNVQQEPTTAYGVSGTTLTFTAAPSTGTNNIYVIHRGGGSTGNLPPQDLGATDYIFRDDISFKSDSAKINFGADSDITLTHVADTGLILKNTHTSGNSGIGAILTLQTGDTDVAANNVLGQIDFQAPDEGTGTDAILVAAGISAISEGDFSSSNNATKLVFKTGASAAADSKFEIASDGSLSTPTAGTSNVRFGVNAGNSIASGGNYNVVLGDEAGTALTTGDNNTAIGFEALSTEDADGNNTAIGYQALKTLNAGASGFNTAVGVASGTAMTTGVKNTLLGHGSGAALTNADFNIAIGFGSLNSDTLGSTSVAIGEQTLNAQNFTTATDSKNTAVGHNAGKAVTTGVKNTLIGTTSGVSLTDADLNTAVGFDALAADTLGSRSVAIGKSTLNAQNFTTATDTYNTAVGYHAGLAVTTGVQNTLIGGLAGDALTDADGNVAVGYASLTTNVLGSDSVAIGKNALNVQNPATAVSMLNVAVGKNAGEAITTGTHNTFVGALAGDATDDGARNTAVGYLSLTSNCGNKNTAIGALAGQAATGINNTIVGEEAGILCTGDGNTFIGAYNSSSGGCGEAMTTGDNNTILGAFNGNQNSVDIRTEDNNVVISDGGAKVKQHMDFHNRNVMYSTYTTGYGIKISNSAASGVPEGINIITSGVATDSTSGHFLKCTDSSADRIVIDLNGSIRNHDNSYGAISDERVKQDISDASSQWDDIKAVKVRKYKMKDDVAQYNDKAWEQIGVIAQELEASGMDKLVDIDSESEEKWKSVKYSVLYMKAIKALQEAMTRIETLESENTEIKNRLDALEAE